VKSKVHVRRCGVDASRLARLLGAVRWTADERAVTSRGTRAFHLVAPPTRYLQTVKAARLDCRQPTLTISSEHSHIIQEPPHKASYTHKPHGFLALSLRLSTANICDSILTGSLDWAIYSANHHSHHATSYPHSHRGYGNPISTPHTHQAP
jgi:hypothetical protein